MATGGRMLIVDAALLARNGWVEACLSVGTEGGHHVVRRAVGAAYATGK